MQGFGMFGEEQMTKKALKTEHNIKEQQQYLWGI